MISKIEIENFRSVLGNQSIDLAPINILYGPSGGGKSGLFYALLSVKNFFLNPNQPIDNLFNYRYLNLGGFRNVVNAINNKYFAVSFEIDKENIIKVSVQGNNTVEIYVALKNLSFNAQIDFSMPYPVNKNTNISLKVGNTTYNLVYNGFTINTTNPLSNKTDDDVTVAKIINIINQLPVYIKGVDIIPQNRGFTKPMYSPINVSIPYLITDDEVATYILNNPDVEMTLSDDLEEVANRTFRAQVKIGTPLAELAVSEKNSKIRTLLVNDGYGINQLVYMLAKMRIPDSNLIMIEEPEAHLHSKLIRNLCLLIEKIARNNSKQFIISTHSELFVSTLLAEIKAKRINKDKIYMYLVEKDPEKGTLFKKQSINEDGQVEGGLSNFLEAEIENLKAYL